MKLEVICAFFALTVPYSAAQRQPLLRLIFPSPHLIESQNSLLNPRSYLEAPRIIAQQLATTGNDLTTDALQRSETFREYVEDARAAHMAALDSHFPPMQPQTALADTSTNAATRTAYTTFPILVPNVPTTDTLRSIASQIVDVPFQFITGPLDTLTAYLRAISAEPTNSGPILLRNEAEGGTATATTKDEEKLSAKATHEPSSAEMPNEWLTAHMSAAGSLGNGNKGSSLQPPEMSRIDVLIDSLPFEDIVVTKDADGATVHLEKADILSVREKIREEMKKKVWDDWVDKVINYHLNTNENNVMA